MNTSLACGAAPEVSSHWCASLDIQLTATQFGTRLTKRNHRGPLRVQKPFFPEGPRCLHLYLLHPPGGVVGGDHLDVGVCVLADACALVTTPAAQKLYRTSGATSQIHNELVVERGATLEWLPTETIVFDAARGATKTDVRLEPQAQFIGWDMVGLGGPSGGTRFERGHYRSELDISVGGVRELSEHLAIAGGSEVLAAPWGLDGNTAFGTLVCMADDASKLDCAQDAIRTLLQQHAAACAGVTRLDGLMVLRVQAESLQIVRKLMIAAWKLARPTVVGQLAHEPRIWAT